MTRVCALAPIEPSGRQDMALAVQGRHAEPVSVVAVRLAINTVSTTDTAGS